MNAQAEVPMTDPLRSTWEAYRLTSDYANTRSWALKEPHVDGSLWTAYLKGWKAREATTPQPAQPSEQDAEQVQGCAKLLAQRPEPASDVSASCAGDPATICMAPVESPCPKCGQDNTPPLAGQREDAVRKGCGDPTCGCDVPFATEPMQALRFLSGRFKHAGVGEAVARSYARDIDAILAAALTSKQAGESDAK